MTTSGDAEPTGSLLSEVERLVGQLSRDDQLLLLERLARRLRLGSAPSRKPVDLHGKCKGMFPEDFDVDAALHEIRTEWEKEWTDDGEFVG